MSEFDYGSVNARIAAFDKSHGAFVCEDGWIYFEDGAVRERNPMGLLVEPPDDPVDLAKRKVIYRKFVFERAVREFDHAKHQRLSRVQSNLNSRVCGPVPFDGDSPVPQLKALHSKARAAKAALDRATVEFDSFKPAHAKRREQEDAENRRENEKMMAELRKIEL